MPRLDFIPERDGWHFENNFENRILPGITNITTTGLCGGMVMTALDYWRARVPIPAHQPSDLPPDRNGARLPDEASTLRRYIYDRQMNSLLTKLMFTRWVVFPWFGPQDFHNWAVGSEFDIVRQQIDRQRPTMLGLWSMSNGPTSGHQVLCYGYDYNPHRLYIYDPNFADEESVMTPISADAGVRVQATRSGRQSIYRGYFFTDVYNWDENPPYAPPYRDIVITQGLSLDPPGIDLQTQGRLSLSVTLQNIGEYPSRFDAMVIWARDPRGQNIDNSVGGIEANFKSLNPGEQRTIARQLNSFGAEPGEYNIGVSIASLKGHWQSISTLFPHTVNHRRIRLWTPKQLIVEKWIDVPESSRQDVNSGIDMQPGDEFELTGTGAIWSGVVFTGLNGPEGWTDRIETNPASPYINRPNAHPFSLVGRFGGGSYFYVGRGLSRRGYGGSALSRLFLRINDNTPANGSGQFRCLVRVWR